MIKEQLELERWRKILVKTINDRASSNYIYIYIYIYMYTHTLSRKYLIGFFLISLSLFKVFFPDKKILTSSNLSLVYNERSNLTIHS